MTLFFRRFIGALMLDAGTFEEIEANRQSAMQSVIVVWLVCLAGGVAVSSLGLVGVSGFASGLIISLGAWLVWAVVVITLGTIAVPEPQTKSDLAELLRVLGFASAPGVFLVFAALPSATPLVLVIVAAWTIAGAVIAVRQALDYRSTPRAVAVCAVGWLLSFGLVFAVLMIFSRSVS